MHSFNDIFVVIVATMEKTKKKKNKKRIRGIFDVGIGNTSLTNTA